MHRNVAATVAGAALVLTAILAGPGAASAATTGVDSSSQDVVAHTAANRYENNAGGSRTTLLSVDLPAGAWVLTMNATLVNFSASDYARCGVFVGGGQVAGATATVGNPAASGSMGAASYVSTVSAAAGVTLPGTATVTLQCWHDNYVAGGAPYVDAGAALTAHKSDALVSLTQ